MRLSTPVACLLGIGTCTLLLSMNVLDLKHRSQFAAVAARASGSSSRSSNASGLPRTGASLHAAVPFVVLFESSSGSSWLTQELAAMSDVCMVRRAPEQRAKHMAACPAEAHRAVS